MEHTHRYFLNILYAVKFNTLIKLSTLFFLISPVFAQNESLKVANIYKTEVAPVIDGVIDDDVWNSATIIDDFIQVDPAYLSEPTEKTTFYVTYDSDFLYVAARLEDSDPSAIIARVMTHNTGVITDDLIGVRLDPFNQKTSGYSFWLNAIGTRQESIFDTKITNNSNWNGIWYAQSQITEWGWSAEIAIPFKSINFDPSNPDWGFNFVRLIRRKNERVFWSEFDRNANLDSFGVVKGFNDINQGLGLDIIPSVSLKQNKDFPKNKNESSVEPSADIFYKFNPTLTGVLTLNTDFSDTEVDDRQLNLTRFSLFFPEKRNFFLQDMDIFSFANYDQWNRNANPFFTRRIGLSATGQPIDINSGLKLTGRSGRLNIGVLGVQQDSHQSLDKSDLFVARVMANVLDESNIGLLFTSGNPRSNLDNKVAGLDFRYRNTSIYPSKRVEGDIWYTATDTPGVDQDQDTLGVTFAIQGEEGIRGKIEYEVVEKNYNPALGFVNRKDFKRVRWWSGYRRNFDNHPWIRSAELFISTQSHNNDQTGNLESYYGFIRPIRLITRSGHNYSVAFNKITEVLTEPFEVSKGVIVPIGSHSYDEWQIEADFSQNSNFSPKIVVKGGGFYNGTRNDLEATLRWRPSNKFFLSSSIKNYDVDLPNGNFTTRLVQISSNYNFTNRLYLYTSLQYDDTSSNVGFNTRLRFNREAGENLYLVFDHNANTLDNFSRFNSTYSQFSIKYSKTFRY
ncbi:MAG: hypothetical protein CMQ51_07325 [Gammaproteobacteria bacterium]|nr:hypothetical protein [Gammaproteobacteria bacterium]|tara:strand:- start:565 stop:2769 length:2205 start_codon:yes stop_codon:yes gene_type:complete